MSAESVLRRDIPDATVARLPEYLRTLTRLTDEGVTSVSSEELASEVGVRSAQLRKDLSHLGSYGVRGVGYDVELLARQISIALGLTQDWSVAIVGMGNLGHALASYSGFITKGFRIVALFDDDPALVGRIVEGVAIRPFADLPAMVCDQGVAIGVITTPAPAAQVVADGLVAAGVTSILNFAPVSVVVPPGVEVRRVDMSTELQILAFHAQKASLGVLDPTDLDSAQDAARCPGDGTASDDLAPVVNQ